MADILEHTANHPKYGRLLCNITTWIELLTIIKEKTTILEHNKWQTMFRYTCIVLAKILTDNLQFIDTMICQLFLHSELARHVIHALAGCPFDYQVYVPPF